VPFTSVGFVVSFTVIVCVAVVVFPQVSVAVHVRVITLLQEEPGCDSFELGTTVTDVSQLSVAVTVGAAGTSL